MNKSANQRYKESKSTLSFKDWLTREKQIYYHSFDGNSSKNSMLLNVPLNDSVQSTLADIRKDAGMKEDVSGKTTFGVNNAVYVVAGIVALGIVATIIYKHYKK
ncbi:MAG: hypothetical protein RLY43_932 [Bacteroidota bacterium]|jgi:hypothetical protein